MYWWVAVLEPLTPAPDFLIPPSVVPKSCLPLQNTETFSFAAPVLSFLSSESSLLIHTRGLPSIYKSYNPAISPSEIAYAI